MDIVAHEVIWNFVKNYGLMGHLDCASNSISDQWNQVKVDWSVFPNPANNQLNIATPDAASWSFNLSNAQGQVMQCIQSSGSTHTISCDNLPPGMYWMRGDDANGKHFSTRVVIER